MNPRKGKTCAQGYKAGRWGSWDWNPRSEPWCPAVSHKKTKPTPGPTSPGQSALVQPSCLRRGQRGDPGDFLREAAPGRGASPLVGVVDEGGDLAEVLLVIDNDRLGLVDLHGREDGVEEGQPVDGGRQGLEEKRTG